MSHPVRGAWVEIVAIIETDKYGVSHPVRGAWVEIGSAQILLPVKASRTP